MKRKVLIFILTVSALACMLALSVSAAEWFGNVEQLDGIKVEDHIKSPVTADTPELGEPTEAARVKLSCTCEAGGHTFPAYYVAHKESGNTEMWYFNFNDVNARLTCGGAEMGTKNIIAYEFPNGITAIGCTMYCDCKEMNLKFLSFERAKTLTKMGSTWSGKNWFANSPIEEVRFGPYVTNVANWLFYNCQSLGIIDFGESSQITTIGDYAFYNNKAVTEVILPDTVEVIGNCAFRSNTNLGAFYISSSLTQIGYSTNSNNSPFDGCEKLYFINDRNDTTKPSVYYLPKSVTQIIGEAFKGCKNLNDVIVFHEGITSVANGWAFCNSNAISLVFLGDMVEVCTPGNQSWNNGITLYFCNENDLSKNDVTTSAKCSFVFCFAEGNATHLKELSKSTEATCELPKMVADYCFCGAVMGEPAIDGTSLGHNYKGAVTYAFTSVIESGKKCTACTNGCGTDLVENLTPVYTELGYSANINNAAITNGYKVDRESLKLYEQEKGVTLKLGFAFNSAEGFTDGDVTLESFKFTATVDNPFDYYDVKICFADDEHVNDNIIMGVYVVEMNGEDKSVYFINRTAQNGVNGFEAVSYSALINE